MNNKSSTALKRIAAFVTSTVILLSGAVGANALAPNLSASIVKQYVKYAHLDGSRTGGYSGQGLTHGRLPG